MKLSLILSKWGESLGESMTAWWRLEPSTVTNRTYFGLLLSELSDECHVFTVFCSLFTQLSHHLRCLSYAGLDGFVSGQMGLHHLWNTWDYCSKKSSHMIWKKSQEEILWKTGKHTQRYYFSRDCHSQIRRVLCMFVWRPLCLRRRRWARWCSGNGRCGHLWYASPSAPPEKHTVWHWDIQQLQFS